MAEVILDLAAFQEETADIRMADGRLLRLKKPSEALVIELLGLQHIDEKKPEEITRALNRVTGAVLNNNDDGIEFTPESVKALGFDAKVAIIQAYTDFAVSLQANPTVSSPSSPETRQMDRRSWRKWFTRSRSTRG